MSRARQKGTGGENEIVTLLRRWWPHAERRALHGIRDTGDIAGTGLIWSVKRCESWPIHKWLTELQKMRANDNGAPGFIVARRNRDQWVAVIPWDSFAHLLDLAHGRES